jgi:hypothetical protein
VGDSHRERERDREGQGDEAQMALARGVEGDLETGQEEEEDQADLRQHLDGRVHVGDVQDVRADQDPGDDLGDHRRHFGQRQQVEDERRGHRRGGHDREVVVVEPGYRRAWPKMRSGKRLMRPT